MKLTLRKCSKCGKDIKKDEKAVLLKIFDYKRVYEELYFHLNCWLQDLKEKDEKRAIELYTNSMRSSMGILKNIIGKNNNGKESNQSFILGQGAGQ